MVGLRFLRGSFSPLPGRVGRRIDPVYLASMPDRIALALCPGDGFLFLAAPAVDGSVPCHGSELHPSGFLWGAALLQERMRLS